MKSSMMRASGIESGQFSRGLIISNPTKAGLSAYDKAFENVKNAALELELSYLEQLDTAPDPENTVRSIARTAQSGDVVFVIGGDGTLDTTVDGLMGIEDDVRPPVIVTPGGTANDFVKNHYPRGMRSFRSNGTLTKFLTQASPVDIHPMQLDITTPDGEQSRKFAVNNAAIGYTARIAALLNTPFHRESDVRDIPVLGLKIQELRTGRKSMEDLTHFAVIRDGENEPDFMLDWTWVHARVAGKYGKYRGMSHAESSILSVISRAKTSIGVGVRAVATMRGFHGGEKVDEVAFQLGSNPALAHTDGETFMVPANSHVRVALSEGSFRTYSMATNRRT